MDTAAATWAAEDAAITTAGAEAADIIMAGAITDPIYAENRTPPNSNRSRAGAAGFAHIGRRHSRRCGYRRPARGTRREERGERNEASGARLAATLPLIKGDVELPDPVPGFLCETAEHPHHPA